MSSTPTFHPTLNDVHARIHEIYLQGLHMPDGIWTQVPSIHCSACLTFLSYDGLHWQAGRHLWCSHCGVAAIILSSSPSPAVLMTTDCPKIDEKKAIKKAIDGPAKLVEKVEGGKRFYTVSSSS